MERVEWVDLVALGVEHDVPWPCFLISVLKSPPPTVLAHCPSASQNAQKVGPSGCRNQPRPRAGKRLIGATRHVGSEAELASGYKSQLLPVSSPLPLPLFLELGPPPLSSCGGRSDFIFLPLTLGCSVASSSLYLSTFFREREIRNPVGTDGTPQGPIESWLEP